MWTFILFSRRNVINFKGRNTFLALRLSLTCSKNLFCSSSRVCDSNYDASSPMTSITHKRHPCWPLLRQPRSTFVLFRSLGTSLRRGSTGNPFFECLFVFVLRPLLFHSRGETDGANLTNWISFLPSKLKKEISPNPKALSANNSNLTLS